MMIDEGQLRKDLTRAMALAVDEADSFDDYFGEGGVGDDYGVARADGVMPADILYLWNYAGQLVDYISIHGLDALDLAERAGNLFLAYQALKGVKSDFEASEMDAILKAATDKLQDLVDQK
ncbi:hypothetical protein [uncultured Cohaesibacter sp.]|uniref:hypothetical protein n=1 Tax=uncultured Cohaesibacter sp. TaxID=1002546 RepID=UPI0029C65C92|nr:hypothetical protein [uncultured Cohaesibacter sp.]